MKNAGFFVGTIAGLLLFALIGAAVDPNVAHFPAISLNGKTNVISDSGTAPTWNGGAWPGGGGDTIWTNSAGTIQPLTTNVSDFKFLINSVQQAQVNPLGAVIVGPFTTNYWGLTLDGTSFVSYRDIANGEQGYTASIVGIQTNGLLVAEQGGFISWDTNNAANSYSRWDIDASGSSDDLELFWSPNYLAISFYINGSDRTLITPANPDDAISTHFAYMWDTSIFRTNTQSHTVWKNLGTTIASIANDGAISAANTNQWKLGGVKAASVTASTTNYVEVIIDGATVKLIKAN